MLPVDARDLIERVRTSRELRTAPVILELDLTEGVAEATPHDPVSMVLSRHRPVLRDVVDGLRRAGGDQRVRAVVAKVGGAGIGLARVQEIRDAVAAFRRSGKPAVAWAESFGDFGPGTVPYYLATAFTEIWLQPSGDLGLTGVASEVSFLHDALDRAGIVPQVAQRHEYKNAANQFTERDFTPAHREAAQRLVSSVADQVVAGVAEARRLDPDAVRAAVDRGPLSGEQAVQAGLVDRLGYRDEVHDAVRDQVGPGTPLLYLSRYQRTGSAQRARRFTAPARPVVALVHGTGQIRQGRSGRGPAGSWMGSSTIAAAVRAAAVDERVKAIVFRVDSPGGSYVASDTVWREVVLARRSGTPVVVSMGDVAGSGGYFVSMAADAIVAQPGTLTGSIGVFGGKPVVRDLLDRFGITRGVVTAGAHADMFSTGRPFTEQEWALVNDWLDRVYEDFVTKVGQGRGMTRDQVHEVARGRVWTGADAVERGLVDELGGLHRAIELASDRAGLPGGREPEIRVLPRFSPLDRLLPAQSSEDPAAAAARGGSADWGSISGLAARLGLPDAGPLLMPTGLSPRQPVR
ncbi:MAG TPA: signal peptide peptidase SppA [Mycobacteriales bacterium]|nr:signal peptide peptidase SppA [Mycobacteriales bacterium]